METETTETVETEETETEDVESAEEVETEEVVEDPAAGLKTALQKERVARRALEKKLREREIELSAHGKSADEVALETAKREAAEEASRTVYERVVKAEFRAAASARGIDPKTAVKLADLAGIEVDDEGDVDSAAIAMALDEVISEHPSLTPSRFKGTADQGTRGKKPEPTKVDPNVLIRAAFKKS